MVALWAPSVNVMPSCFALRCPKSEQRAAVCCDNRPVPATNLRTAREALNDNDPTALLGLREGPWLDAKSGIYDLKSPSGAEELAKDVAAFSNTPYGGLIVVGIGTRVDDQGEVLEKLKPVPRDLVDLDRHRKLIRERITPPPRQVTVEWIDQEAGQGVMYIDIPAQPRGCLPYVVAAPAGVNGKASETSVAIPIREADSTHWLPRTEMHRILASGWGQAGGPSEEALTTLIKRVIDSARPAVVPPPAHEVGGGEPSWKRPFQDAYDKLIRYETVGQPATDVYWDGPGVVQAFEPVGLRAGWVLCALPNQLPVAVSELIWRALHDVGSDAENLDAMTAIGYPMASSGETDALPTFDDQSISIDLKGGVWGNGRLTRDDPTADWRWEPTVTFGFDMTRSSQYWTASWPDVPQLRIRAVATLPWADARGLEITPQRRRELVQALPSGPFAEAVDGLIARRGAELSAAVWETGPNRNALDALSYSRRYRNMDRDIALTAEVMLSLPSATESAVVACAELRLDNSTAWEKAMAQHGGQASAGALPLHLDELCDLLARAWLTATETLPDLVIPGRSRALWTRSPVVELRLTAEHRHDDPGPHKSVTDYVDFSPFGTTDRDHLSVMAITVAAPATMPVRDRFDLTRHAVVRMGRGFGYVDATTDHIRTAAR